MSNYRAILLISGDAKSQEIAASMKKKEDVFREKTRFIEKQIKDMREKYESEIKGDWNDLYKHLVDKGIYKTVDEINNKYIRVDLDAGVIYEHETPPIHFTTIRL